MNVLKALAKMTKLAARLETENVDLRRDVEVSQKRELMIGDQVAVQREKIQSLEAKLFAAEQRGVIPLRCVEAVAVIESLHYAWDTTRNQWAGPVPPPPTAAPVEPTTIGMPDGIGWRDALKAAPPGDMTRFIEAVLFNGTKLGCAAESLDWNESSVGVAWWRFQ